MDFVRGLVVRAGAGRDKGGFYVILQMDGKNAAICDGKRRSLQHPKQKNLKHLFATNTLLPEASLQTNREIRRAIAAFRDGGRFPHEEAN